MVGSFFLVPGMTMAIGVRSPVFALLFKMMFAVFCCVAGCGPAVGACGNTGLNAGVAVDSLGDRLVAQLPSIGSSNNNRIKTPGNRFIILNGGDVAGESNTVGESDTVIVI